MMRLLAVAFATIALTGALGLSRADAQTDKKPPPVIMHASAHSAHFNDFQARKSRDRSLALEVQRKGIDLAFTEWMQRDHPYIFAAECVKQAGGIAAEFKSTNHMADFDALLAKRPDLRLKADKYGHDVAFAEWLRTERPDIYRQHFGLGPDNKPIKKEKSRSK